MNLKTDNENNFANFSSKEANENNLKKSCKLCDKKIITENFNRGVSFCSLCGKVNDFRTYTTKSEGFSNEGSTKDSTERSGSPTNLIFNRNFLQDDFNPKNLAISLEEKSFFNKLAYWDKRIKNTPLDSTEKISNKTYTILTNVSGTLSLSRDFQKKVLNLQEEISKIPAFEKLNLRNFLCSLVFYLAREEGLAYSFSDIVSAFNVTRKNVARTYRELSIYLEKRKETKILKTVPQLIEEFTSIFTSLNSEELSEVILEGENLYNLGESLFSIKIPVKIAKAILCQVLNKKGFFTLKQSCKILAIPETTVIGTGPIKEIFKEYNFNYEG